VKMTMAAVRKQYKQKSSAICYQSKTPSNDAVQQ
jgi:hypothetical protein